MDKYLNRAAENKDINRPYGLLISLADNKNGRFIPPPELLAGAFYNTLSGCPFVRPLTYHSCEHGGHMKISRRNAITML